MTATGVDTQATRASDHAGPAVLAPWAARAGALALDMVPGVALLATAVLVALSVPLHSTWWWVCVSTGAVAILFTAFNRLLLPVIGGHNLGRAVFGITVVRRNGDALGPWWLLLRDLGAPAGHRRGPCGLAVAVMGHAAAHLRRHVTGH